MTPSPWMPEITSRNGPKYLAIADAIGAAVTEGELSAGAKLPPQRNLAYDLGVTLGTVTRAYREAERRGLVGGEVGRGTFVLGSGRPSGAERFIGPDAPAFDDGIDMVHAIPVLGMAGRELATTLAEIAAEPDIDALTGYQFQGGLSRHLEAGRQWMSEMGYDAPVDRMTITNGVQHGMMVALLTAARSGDVVLAEELTYPGFIHMARRLGYRLEGIAMDDQGALPDAFDEACRRTGSKVLYMTPALQNPCAAVTGMERRQALLDVARRHGAFIIEDDVWGPLLPERHPPMASLAPDLVYYVTGLSKCMAGGLRVGYIAAPEHLGEKLRATVRMTTWMTPPLMAEVATRWIADGTGARLTQWQRQRAAERVAQARQHLGPLEGKLDGFSLAGHDNAHYIWMTLPQPWRNVDFKAEMEARGIRVLTAESFAVGRRDVPHAARLCFGAAKRLEDTDRALATIADVLTSAPGGGYVV